MNKPAQFVSLMLAVALSIPGMTMSLNAAAQPVPSNLLLLEADSEGFEPAAFYLDLDSIRPSPDHPHWRHARLIVQPENVQNSHDLAEVAGAQSWGMYITVDCQNQAVRADTELWLSQHYGQGEILRQTDHDENFAHSNGSETAQLILGTVCK